MKAVFYAILVVFAMDYIWASAQQYTVHACNSRSLLLSCRIGLIQIFDVVLADSRCTRSSCCPREGDCRGPPSLGYRNQVHSLCNGLPSCSPSVEIRNIGCGLFPSNDYVNITYRCIATEPSTVPSTSFPSSTTQLSSSLSTTSRSTTPSTSAHIETTHPPMLSTSAHIKATPPPDEKATEPPQKPAEPTPEFGPEEAAAHAQPDQENDYGYLDRITVLLSLAVIVGGVVITVTVISVAVILVTKKRRIVKTEESYDIPNFSCNANTDEENFRNSNFYDSIPDPGICNASQSANVDDTEKENEYLKPVNESDETPYLWIP